MCLYYTNSMITNCVYYTRSVFTVRCIWMFQYLIHLDALLSDCQSMSFLVHIIRHSLAYDLMCVTYIIFLTVLLIFHFYHKTHFTPRRALNFATDHQTIYKYLIGVAVPLNQTDNCIIYIVCTGVFDMFGMFRPY